MVDYVIGIDSLATSATSAYVDEAYLSFTNTDSSGYMNITNAGPSDSQPIQALSWVSYIPAVGNTLNMIMNGYVAAYNANAAVSSDKQTDTSSNRVYYLRKNIRTIGRSADFPSKTDTSYGVYQNTQGGVEASFDYQDWASGYKGLECGARMDYMVDDHALYYGWFYSEAAIVTWTANFMS